MFLKRKLAVILSIISAFGVLTFTVPLKNNVNCNTEKLNEQYSSGTQTSENQNDLVIKSDNDDCAAVVFAEESDKSNLKDEDNEFTESKENTAKTVAENGNYKDNDNISDFTQSEKPEIENSNFASESDDKCSEDFQKISEEGSCSICDNSKFNQYEKEVVTLVNQIRNSYGLHELKLNEKLSLVAREKSKDMAVNKYFSHNSPTFGSPFLMMKQFGINYRTAGENIAYGYTTPKSVVDGWMNSEGHRANILNASFAEIGVGYYESGNYWTQMFIG